MLIPMRFRMTATAMIHCQRMLYSSMRLLEAKAFETGDELQEQS